MDVLRRILATAATVFYRAYSLTYRVKYINDAAYRTLPPDRKPYIFAHLHEDDLAMIGPHRNRGYYIIISLSKDGDILAYAMKKLGFHVVRGSSSRGGMRGLIQLIRAVRQGSDAIVTVDGPRGPRREVKPGIVMLAYKTRTPIMPVVAHAKRRFVFQRSWNKTYLPLPFTRVTFLASEPIPPPEDNSPEEMERCRKAVEAALREMKARFER